MVEILEPAVVADLEEVVHVEDADVVDEEGDRSERGRPVGERLRALRRPQVRHDPMGALADRRRGRLDAGLVPPVDDDDRPSS